MLSKEQKIKIRQFAEEKIKHNDSTHRMPHIKETIKWALHFANLENAGRDICWASAMLHDICKWEEEHGKNHGITGAETAAEYLTKLKLDKAFIEKVKDAIYYHDKPFEGGSKERQILWDADKVQNELPAGFKKRMIPYWEERADRKEAIRLAIDEYYFFYPLFHTESGKKEVAKNRKAMELLFRKLTAE
ncbi:MAG: HD domain-containing protein [Candidatus Nanoarchaeia archaeon]|jgi:hypothetical protein